MGEGRAREAVVGEREEAEKEACRAILQYFRSVIAMKPDDDIEVSIKDEDLRIDTYTWGVEVCITHLPSGLSFSSAADGSREGNRARAMNRLRVALIEKERRRRGELDNG